MRKTCARERSPRAWQALGNSGEARVACKQGRAEVLQGLRYLQKGEDADEEGLGRFAAGARRFASARSQLQVSDIKRSCRG
jgi:hypothetical protein